MRRLAHFFRLLAVGTATLVLSACYGVIAVMYGVPMFFRGKVVVRNAATIPLPNIQVSYRTPGGSGNAAAWSELGYTGADGELAYTLAAGQNPPIEIRLQDIDGSANGGEYQTVVGIADEDIETIVLPPKP